MIIYLYSLYHQIKYNSNSIYVPFVAESWGCVFTSNTINIMCQQHQHIYILKTILHRSDASCANKKTCCRDFTVCSDHGSLERLHQLQNWCDGKRHCQLDVDRQECDYGYYTDNERIYYFCIKNSAGKLELGIAILKYTIDLVKI